VISHDEASRVRQSNRAQTDLVCSTKFVARMRANPSWSDADLLNSNNPGSAAEGQLPVTSDVLVAGAGINGLIYSVHLKTIMPHAEIVVLEKSSAPAYKIGESTLSPFTRLMNTHGIAIGCLLRLFGIKDGLDFICLDQSGLSFTTQDVGGLDVSYQLERRVSELFFTMLAQRLGVTVIHGASVDFSASQLGEGKKRIVFRRDGSEGYLPPGGRAKDEIFALDTAETGEKESLLSTLECDFICDATGFSRRLTSQYAKRAEFKGFNTNAYWAYFREKSGHTVTDLPFWDHPGTKHVCFPDGWGWFIRLISWEKTPLANLMDLIDYVLDYAFSRKSPDGLASAQELARDFNCNFEWIVSIGWAVRDDVHVPDDLSAYGSSPIEQRLKYFQKKYPLLDGLMEDHYELIENHYGRTYFSLKRLTYFSPVVAGPGWLSVGNASGFTNPLVSPGINVGLGTACLAAQVTANNLARSETSLNGALRGYQAFVEALIAHIDGFNRLWYFSFRDVRAFETLISVVLAFAVASESEHYTHFFHNGDIRWALGTSEQGWDVFFGEVLPLVTGPAPEVLSEDALGALRRSCEKWRDHCVRAYPSTLWSACFRHYNDALERVPDKSQRFGSRVALERCSCQAWKPKWLRRCPICGAVRGAPAV
jgi:flavin-dependent dehydrogenase